MDPAKQPYLGIVRPGKHMCHCLHLRNKALSVTKGKGGNIIDQCAVLIGNKRWKQPPRVFGFLQQASTFTNVFQKLTDFFQGGIAGD